MKKNFKMTLIACYICFIIQAIVNNLSPLLFVTYSDTFGVSLDQIAFLVSFNFIVQMMVDMLGCQIRGQNRLPARNHHRARLFCRRKSPGSASSRT